MKPIRLEIEGIRSFKDKTIIEFEALIKRGLFGIFGNTGSGKSSILYCINLALYYNNSKEFEKKNLINTKCENAFVSLTFELTDEGQKKIYTVTREFKAQGNVLAYLYLVEGDKKSCIQEKTTEVTQKIIQLIGLNLDDFKKCIALPQGEFSSFIKSTSGAKMDIIARLFSLEDYSEKIFLRAKERKEILSGEYENYKTRLFEYEDTGKEIIEKLDTERDYLKASIETEQKILEDKKKSYETNKKIFEFNSEYEKADLILNKLLNEKTLIENKKILIDKAEKYSDIFEEKTVLKNAEIDLIQTEKEIKIITENKSKHIEKQNLITKEIESRNFDKETEEITAKKTMLLSIESTIKQLDQKKIKREQLREDYKNKSHNTILLKEESEIIEKKLNDVIDKLNKTILDNTLDYENIKPIFLLEEYKYLLKYFTKKQTDLNTFKDNSRLYFAVDKEIELQINNYSSKINGYEDIDISTISKNLKEKNEVLENIRKIKNNYEKDLITINEKIAHTSTDMERLLNEGKEISKEIEVLIKAINDITGGEDYKKFTIEINIKQVQLKKYRDDIYREQDEIKEKINKCENEYNLSIQKQDSLKKSIKLHTENLSKKLISAKIENVENIEDYNLSAGEKQKIIEEIEYYNDNFSAIKAKHSELKNKIDINITKEDIDRKKIELNNSEKELTAKNSRLAVCISETGRLKDRLVKKDELIKKQKAVAEKLTIAEQLFSIVSKKKFMEFVAEEYLCDMAQSASKLLLELTNGRYNLTYERQGSESDFFVGDNFDEGKLRNVSTLSGGETFLVSLTLAVSLSETIYQKSLRPMEFFFLDEGFGTLDSGLIETVISSLEKLKDTHFSIGLISHVQELKERISSKILVTAADENSGSKIEIIY